MTQPAVQERRSSRRQALRRARWELATLASFVLGTEVAGLLGCLIGAGMASRSRFWEVQDKVRALLGIPVGWLLIVVLRAWVTATWIRPAPASGARLQVAGHSLAEAFRYGPGVIGLLIAAYLGFLLVRDARWT
jgi:hypothetical protein